MDQSAARELAATCGRAGFRATVGSHGYARQARYVVRLHPDPDRPPVELSSPADFARLLPTLRVAPADTEDPRNDETA